MKIVLARARPEDARLLWRWANEPGVRAASYRSDPIPWTEHRAWLDRKLAEPRTRIYVARGADGRPLGQLRVEADVVGVSVAPRLRGRGIGSALISAGCRRAARELRLRRIRAYVKTANEASAAAFLKAGFRRVRRLRLHGTPSLLLSWTRSGADR